MRRAGGIALVAIGVVAMLLGGAVAVLLGPDDRVETGPHPVDMDERALVTAPSVIAYTGPQISIVAELGDERPVFLGLAHHVDLDDYLSATAHREVTSYQVPWSLDATDVGGDPFLPAAPTALDWWMDDASGLGGAQLRFRLPDESVSVAVLALGDDDLDGLRMTVAYEWAGGFGVGLGAAVAGLGLVGLGLTVLRVRPFARRAAVPVGSPSVVDDEWDTPWPESDPADVDTEDDFLEEAR